MEREGKSANKGFLWDGTWIMTLILIHLEKFTLFHRYLIDLLPYSID
jgi:hypothetical protein